MCKYCGSTKLINVYAPADGSAVVYQRGAYELDIVPESLGIGREGNIDFVFCANCRTIQ